MFEVIKLLIAAFLGGLSALYIPILRRNIWGARLKPSFSKDIPGCVAITPILLQISDKIINTEGYYIRILIKNVKDTIGRECRVFLTNIEKQDNSGSFQPTLYFDSNQLQWASRSNKGFSGIDIPRDINQFADVIETIRETNSYSPKIEMMPFRYIKSDLFKEEGIFRYTIQVSGNEVMPETIKIIFHWKGKWDDFGVYQDSQSQLSTNNWLEDIIFQIINTIRDKFSKR